MLLFLFFVTTCLQVPNFISIQQLTVRCFFDRIHILLACNVYYSESHFSEGDTHRCDLEMYTDQENKNPIRIKFFGFKLDRIKSKEFGSDLGFLPTHSDYPSTPFVLTLGNSRVDRVKIVRGKGVGIRTKEGSKQIVEGIREGCVISYGNTLTIPN